MTSKVLFDLLLIQKKSFKQDCLLRKNVSTHVYKLAECYRLLAINDTITLDSFVNLIFIAVTNKPRIYCETLHFSYSSEYKCVIKAKYTQLLKVGIFKQINKLLTNKKAIRSYIFKKKLNEYGNYIKFKIYIVAKGFLQVSSKNFSETFSFIAKFTTLHMFLALVTYLDFEIYQVNIVTAYLQDDLNNEIYMIILDNIS